MRSKPGFNHKQFNLIQAEYQGQHPSDTVINPARNFDGKVDRPPSEYMALDLRQVLESDIIILLPEWEESEGAQREVQVALWAGKKFLKAEEASPHWRFPEVDNPEFSSSLRAQMLDEAKQCITGDRNNSYGPPWQDFRRTAGALNAMGYRAPNNRRLQSHDIAIFIMMVKISRLMWTPTKRDSWVDIAGYAGCGLECALHDDESRRESDDLPML